MLAQAAAIAFWIVLGAVGIWAGARLEVGSLAAPQAGLMPVLAGGALVVFGLFALAQQLMEKVPPPAPSGQRLGGPLAAVALLCVYAVLFEKAGFVPSTFVLVALLARLLGSGGWLSALALGAGASGLSYAVFKLALGVPLP